MCRIAFPLREPFAPSCKGHQIKGHTEVWVRGQLKAAKQEREARLVQKPRKRPTVYQSQYMKQGIDRRARKMGAERKRKKGKPEVVLGKANLDPSGLYEAASNRKPNHRCFHS